MFIYTGELLGFLFDCHVLLFSMVCYVPLFIYNVYQVPVFKFDKP